MPMLAAITDQPEPEPNGVDTDAEKQLVKEYTSGLATKNRYLVDCQNEFITIYESIVNKGAKEILSTYLKYSPAHSEVDFDHALAGLINYDDHYTAMMRFHLVDREQRTFTAERFCFRGAIDDWIYLDCPDALEKLAKRYVPLLGTEDFFNTPHL